MASDWITSGLRELKVQTSSPEMMRKHRDNLRILPGNPEKEVSLFELTGASYVITGSYYARDDQMEVSSRLESTETGDVIYNFPAVSGPLDQKEELVDEVRERIKGYWAVKEAEDLSRYNPPKYEAYRALFECGGFGEVWCLMNALSLDTTFMLARVYLYYSSALWDMDSLHEATGRYIREHRDECTEFKKNYVDFVNHIKQQRYEAEAMDLDKNVELDPKELKSVDWENYLTNPWSGNNEWYIKLWVEGMTGASYARLGMRNEALAQVDTLESMRQDEPNNLNRMFSGEIPYYQARIYAILEEPELSMQALQQSMDEGRMSEWDNYVNDPDLAGLRDYQPYLDLFGLR